jgi:hypothetical protein
MDWKHPIVVIIVAAVVIVGLYYLMSPYQNCARLYPNDLQGCIIQTSW